MECIPELRTRTRHRPLVGTLTIATAILIAGCGGGGSQSVISTGFPQGGGPFSVTTKAASGVGALTLQAQNVPTPVFFPAPTGVPDTGASGCASGVCTSSTSGTLALIPGTVYQLQNPTQPKGPFPSPVTLSITYPSAAGHDLNTLNIYYYDGQSWQPVAPAAGGFLSQSGQIQTTVTTIQGKGLYAAMSSAPPKSP